MVKNTTGGTGTKSLARKQQTRGDSRLQLVDNDFEKYAIVTKLLGNGMCEIHLNDNTRLIGHIRNKFRGKNKRHNLVSLLSVVLVGLRDYEKPFKNCDILTIYDDLQIEQLRQIPSVRLEYIMQLRLETVHSGFKDSNCMVEFTTEEDSEPLINTLKTASSSSAKHEEENMPEINIDDI
jgi:initiation factor 1A